MPFARCGAIFVVVLLGVVMMYGCGDEDASASIVFSNVRMNGTLESGFITGSVQGVTATSFEVSWNGGTDWEPVAGTSSWKIRIPLAWKTGYYNTVRMRAVTADGSAGDSALTVRKGANRDWDGDGYPDLPVSEYSYNSGAGRVRLYGGGPGAMAPAPSSMFELAVYFPTEGAAGTHYAQGDFNGDGYSDLVLHDATSGFLHFFNGSGVGPVSGAILSNGDFSGVLAVGDFDGDGCDDLAAASDGRVRVFLADGTNGIAGRDLTAGGTADWVMDGMVGQVFGSGLAAGDYDRDGYADLAVGSAQTYQPSESGKVSVFYGSGTGLAGTPGQEIPGPAARSWFGSVLASGDVNGDGYLDLVVGAYGYQDTGAGLYRAGYAAVYAGGDAGLATTALWSTVGSLSNKYGAFTACGDIDGDGYDDLAIYAGGQQIPGTGRVFLYRGSADGPATTPWRTLEGETNGNYFGALIHISDLNGDGYADMYLLDDGFDWDDSPDANLGKAYWYRGSASGISTTPDWSFNGYFNVD